MRSPPVAVALVLAFAASAPAHAQSKRYPPEPVDKDQEKQDHSDLWENATNPQTKPYGKLIAEARSAINDRTDEGRRSAIDKLDQAIALVPADPVAYRMRGEAHMELKEWAKCADDLQAASEKAAPDDLDARAHTELRRQLGLCLARAGRLAHAERVLAEAAASGTSTGEMLMRLGEVRIAMGKLDEAIAALTAEPSDGATHALARWLLTAAYDRGRRPAEAIETARKARSYDRDFSALVTPTLPLLGVGEREYLLGLAWEYARGENDPAEPERAILFFRRFVKLAPDSPWRKRADEHLRDLERAVLPEALARKQGGAAYDLEAARAIVRKRMAALHACVARTPNVVFTVTVTKSGPKQIAKPPPPPPPSRYPYYRPYQPRPPMAPPEGVAVEAWNESDPTPRADKDAAMRCLEPIVTKLPFAPVKEANAYVVFSWSIISP